jgi:DNA-binding CsgD family transcriptional regulator
MPVGNLDRALDACYDTLVAPKGWPAAFDALARAAGAVGCMLRRRTSEGSVLDLPMPESLHAFMADYVREGYVSNDYRAQAGWDIVGRAGGRTLIDHDFVPDHVRRKHLLLADLHQRHDLPWWAGVGVVVDGHAWVLAILRNARQGPFDREEGRRLARLTPHLRRVVAFSERLGVASAGATLGALERLRMPAMLLYRDGTVGLMNAAAEALVGPDLRLVQRQLRATHPPSDRALQGLIASLLGRLPGTKAILHVADTAGGGAIGVLQRGFDDGLMADYDRYYAKLNPWVPFLVKAPVLQALVADERLPASSFRESEFYRDWMMRDRGMESSTGIKLVHEADRMGVLAIHYAAGRGERYNRRLAHVLQASAGRLRRAVDAARLARSPEAAQAAPVPLDAFVLPAFLLDARGRVLGHNRPAQALIGGPSLSLGVGNALRLGDAALSERLAAVAGQIAAGRGPWCDGLNLSVTVGDGARYTLSLLAVRAPSVAGLPGFFAPMRLTLLLVRPGADAGARQTLCERFGLTPAERQLALRLATGLSLRESADRLGIASNTARFQLRAVFAKTGTSRQGELVALIAGMSGGDREE